MTRPPSDKPDSPTDSFALLAHRVRRLRPTDKMREAALQAILERLREEATALGMEAKVDGLTLDITFPASWPRRDNMSPDQVQRGLTDEGVNVNLSKGDRWFVQGTTGTKQHYHFSTQGHSLVPKYDVDRDAFLVQRADGHWRPDVETALTELILLELPPEPPTGA